VNADSPAEIRRVLQSIGATFKKRWGQNMLINRGARNRLIDLLDLTPSESVWEIGPGLGAMTEALVTRDAASILAFEIDRKLASYLGEEFAGTKLRVVQGDVLETWPRETEINGPPERMLGNLPYSSASAILLMLMNEQNLPERSVVTVQRELTERMMALPGDPGYSSFSVLCGVFLKMVRCGDLSPGSFYPSPRVYSTVLTIEPRAARARGAAAEILPVLTRQLFRARRKTIRNNVAAGRWPQGMSESSVTEAMHACGFEPGRRAQDYPPDSYAALAAALAQSPR
jgi:16S rRNA (adenine1518-N6/adenine1519-N6)-dimethyltransferase